MRSKFQIFIEQAEGLIGQNADTPEFNAWRDNVKRFLKKTYGDESHEAKAFSKIIFFSPFAVMEHGYQNDQTYRDGLQQAILYLKNYQDDYTDENGSPNKGNNENAKDVFIIHGRNERVKNEVANFLTILDLQPIMLNEQANKGRTIIEKFEDHSNVMAAIALFTSDDVGKLKDCDELEDRARQNVIFEAGYFIGKLGRERTIILYEDGLKIPSDLSGYLYIPLDSDKQWHQGLIKELKAIGFNIGIKR